MTSTRELAEYLNSVLDVANVPDYPNAFNGLQLENDGTVSQIAASVDFSTRAIKGTKQAGADFLLVHHGMFWNGAQPITNANYVKLRGLIEGNIAVYSAHLPLDRHTTFGNNMLLCRELGLKPSGEFAWYKQTSIGLSGDASVPTKQLIEAAASFAELHHGHVIAPPVSDTRITRKWAVCTGAGASSDTLREAFDKGIDTLVVGEGPHHTAVEAEELGITVIYAGHYATETLGVKALAKHAAEHFGVEWTMIAAPTGL